MHTNLYIMELSQSPEVTIPRLRTFWKLTTFCKVRDVFEVRKFKYDIRRNNNSSLLKVTNYELFNIRDS